LASRWDVTVVAWLIPFHSVIFIPIIGLPLNRRWIGKPLANAVIAMLIQILPTNFISSIGLKPKTSGLARAGQWLL
jgi:hypothetical protein